MTQDLKLVATYAGAKMGNPVNGKESMVNVPTPFYRTGKSQLTTHFVIDLHYGTSLDWLNPVWQKVVKDMYLFCANSEGKKQFTRTNTSNNFFNQYHAAIDIGTSAEAFAVVVEAINWLNSQKKK